MAVTIVAAGLSACQPPVGPVQCRYNGNVRIVSGPSGVGNDFALATIAAGSNWNAGGGRAPDFVWEDTGTTNTVTVHEVNAPTDTRLGWTNGTNCPFSNRDVTLNRGTIGTNSGLAVFTAAHEFGHAIGLGHDPFHDGETGYQVVPGDCGLVALMFWRADANTVCGITGPTTWDVNAVHTLY